MVSVTGLVLLLITLRASADTQCACQGLVCSCNQYADPNTLQKDVSSSIASAPRTSMLGLRGPAPIAGPAGLNRGLGLADAAVSASPSSASNQYSLPDSNLSNPMLELSDPAPALSPMPTVTGETTAAGPSPESTRTVNPATVSQYMVAGTTVIVNKTSSEAELTLVCLLAPFSSTR